MYDNGKGVTKNLQEAIKWYKKAAEQGDADAQFNLGVMYENGEGVTKNLQEAFKWYLEAAEQGNARAQNNLGIMYENGKGVQMDIQQAIRWYRKSAALDNAKAMANLGYLYDMGIGVSKDTNKAFSLYKDAAEKGNAYGQRNLALCYYYGDCTEKDISLAIYWIKKAMDGGDTSAKELYNMMKSGNSSSDISFSTEGSTGTTTVFMNKRNGLYYVPCKINGEKSDFIFDTGATTISLSASFADRLLSQGLLSKNDFKGEAEAMVADGSTSKVIIVNIKDVEIGGLHLRNVMATIKEQQNAPLLLGQSVIEKLGKITIDGSKLIIHKR